MSCNEKQVVSRTFGDDEIVMYAQPGRHALFARPTGDGDIETPVWGFDSMEEVEWAVEALQAVLTESNQRRDQ